MMALISRRARRAALFAAGFLVATASFSAWGQSQIPDAIPFGTNGSITSIAHANGLTYIAGAFSIIGKDTGFGVPIAKESGRPQEGFPRINGTVRCCAPDGANGWYVGGSFTCVGDTPRNRIAHIFADGTVDPAWNPDADGDVQVITVSGATVYAGGAFGRIGGAERIRVAALDAAGLATPWNPGVDPKATDRQASWVRAICVSDGRVYLGGAFRAVGGQPRISLAAIDADSTGTLTAWNPGALNVTQIGTGIGSIYDMETTGSLIFVAGYYTHIAGQPRNKLAVISLATGEATAWDAHLDGEIYAIALSGSRLYLGGLFTSVGGQARNYLAAVDSGTGAVLDWNPDASLTVSAFAIADSTVYAGGFFGTIGGVPRLAVAAIDENGTLLDWNPGSSGNIAALAISDEYVFVGGIGSIIGGTARGNLACLDANGVPTDWNPGADQRVNSIAISGPTLYAGGYFNAVGGQPRKYLAAVDLASGEVTDWNPSPAGGYITYINTLDTSGSLVYVGGSFTSIGGKMRSCIAALDESGAATDWNPNATESAWGDPLVSAVKVSGSTVYVSGSFVNIGGQPRNKIAAIDGATGLATEWNPAPNGAVSAFAVSGSTVYVGGGFTSIGGAPRNRIAALEAYGSGAATEWNPNADGEGANTAVYALLVEGEMVYAGGFFKTIGGAARSNLAALNPAGIATTWNPAPNNRVQALSAGGSKIHVGGQFSVIGGQNRPAYARFTPDPAREILEALLGLRQAADVMDWTLDGNVDTADFTRASQ